MSKGKFSIKIVVAMLAAMLVMLCGACGQQTKNDADPEAVKQAYEAFVQEQKEAGSKEEIYAAITTTSEEGSQVLLIADDVFEIPGDNSEMINQATKAGVYTYSDGQIAKICDIESTSTAYPIGSVEGKYLVTGSHHTVERYLVSANAANVEKVEGIAMEEGDYKMTTYTVSNDEISDAEEKVISETEGEDFATAIYDAWEPVEFTKY